MSLTRWPKRVVLATAVWVAVCGVALFFGMRPHPVLVALLLAATGGALLLFLDTSGEARTPEWRHPVDDPVRPPGEDPRLALLERVVSSHLVAHDVGDQLHRHLADLMDQRLLAHRGVSRLADPERATRLLGPELTAFAETRPPYPRLTLDEIDTLISRIERL